jgi:hypothetical protein
MRLQPLWALLVATPVALAAPAPDTYVLKLKRDADPGKATVIKTVEKHAGTLKILGGDGKAVQEVQVSEEKEEVYTKTVLERGDRKAKKYKKVFEKAVRTADGKTTPLPYQGRTVVYEVKDGKYQASAEGAPQLDQHILDELARGESSGSPDLSDVVLPGKPVGVGDKWTLGGKDIAKSFAEEKVMTLDPEGTKGDATLTKVYRKDGHQFGVIEVTMKLAIKSDNGVAFDPPGTMDLKATLDVAIDGSTAAGTTTLTGQVAGKGALKQGDQTIAVDFHIDVSARKERSAEK